MNKDSLRYYKGLDLESFPARTTDAGTSKVMEMEKATYIVAFASAAEAPD